MKDLFHNERFPGETLNSLKEFLEQNKPVVITTHYRPDGDAIGSSLALFNYLILKGHTVSVIAPCEYPDFLHWLPGNDNVINYERNINRCEKLIASASLIFCLDFNRLSRVETGMEKLIRASAAKRVLIDHHLFPEPETFNWEFSYSDSGSTAELIFDFINSMDDFKLINKEIAECIYCGIMTDTNSFRFFSMKARTHRIIASLMESGAENSKIHERVYDNSSEQRMRLIGYSLNEKLHVLNEYHVAYIALNDEELKRFSFESGDTEGLVNLALAIKGIKMAAFFSFKEGKTKISFRSRDDFSVNDFSASHFNGGGHKNAAGGRYDGPIEEAVRKFIDVLPEYKSQLS